jgi:hypothetical protein
MLYISMINCSSSDERGFKSDNNMLDVETQVPYDEINNEYTDGEVFF